MTAALLSALHVLTLGLGLGGVFIRGRKLRVLSTKDSTALRGLFAADSAWGVAALLWIATGLVRAFGGIEKASAFYLRNGFFYAKLACFALVFAIELWPMITLIRWRMLARRGQAPPLGAVPLLIRVNDAEVVLVCAIPLLAAMMARGLWLF